VVFDGARADEQLSGDLSVRVSLHREARDLRFLLSELVDRVQGPFAGALTRGLELDPRALGKRLHPKAREHVVSDSQIVTSVQATTPTSEPLAVPQPGCTLSLAQPASAVELRAGGHRGGAARPPGLVRRGQPSAS
jgi:hypothetical protein